MDWSYLLGMGILLGLIGLMIWLGSKCPPDNPKLNQYRMHWTSEPVRKPRYPYKPGRPYRRER